MWRGKQTTSAPFPRDVILLLGLLAACQMDSTLGSRRKSERSSDSIAVELARSVVDTDTVKERSVAVVLFGSRECSSCRGAGLAIRDLTERVRGNVILVYDTSHTEDVQEFVRTEQLHITLAGRNTAEVVDAVGGDLGGAIVMLTKYGETIRRLGPRDDWPSAVAKWFPYNDLVHDEPCARSIGCELHPI